MTSFVKKWINIIIEANKERKILVLGEFENGCGST
jgi:hypothetical protein